MGQNLVRVALLRGDAVGSMAVAMHQAIDEEINEAATEAELAFALSNAENAKTFITSYMQNSD